MAQPKKAILVITSQVVRGGISGRGLVFALERLGYPVWFLPTILLPWHPGQGKGARIVAQTNEFKAIVKDLIGSGKLNEIGGIITGYLGNADQAGAIAELLQAVKEHSSDALYVCDPVIGDKLSSDRSGLYVPEATACAIRDDLMPLADIATPNLFELGWLTQQDPVTELQAIGAARALVARKVLVTSAPAMRNNSISNLLVTDDTALAAEHMRIEHPPHGTGDLVSGLFLAHLMAGVSDEEALVRAAGSTCEIVVRSVRNQSNELLFAQEQACLGQSATLVSSRRVLESRTT